MADVKNGNKKRWGFNPVNGISNLFNFFFSILRRLMDKMSGKETIQKAKTLEETVATQQAMVKEAEEVFASDRQRAERNLEETKRAMENHRAAMGLNEEGNDSFVAALDTVSGDSRDEKNQSSEASAEQVDNGQSTADKVTDEKAIGEEGSVNSVQFSEVKRSLPKVVNRAIGGLAIDGEKINPYDTSQWFQEGKLVTNFDGIRATIHTKVHALMKQSEDSSIRDEIQQLYFEQLAGSLLTERPSKPSKDNQMMMSVAIAYLLYEASVKTDQLIDKLEMDENPAKVSQIVTAHLEDTFSGKELKLTDERLRAFLLDKLPEDTKNWNLMAGNSFTNWLKNQRARYQVELDEGVSMLSEHTVNDQALFVKGGDTAAGEVRKVWGEEEQQDILEAEYEEDLDGTNDKSETRVAQEQSADEVEAAKENEMFIEGEEQLADDMPFSKKRSSSLSSESAYAKATFTPGEAADYQPSIMEHSIGEVFDNVDDTLEKSSVAETETDAPEKEKAPVNGRSYSDATSVPVNDGMGF